MIRLVEKLPVVGASLLGAVFLLTTPVQAQTEVLQLGVITPSAHVWSQLSERINDNVQKNSNGSLQVDVNSGGKLGSEQQMIDLLQSGEMQLGVLSTGGLMSRDDTLLAWSLPYLFDDVEQATQATQLDSAQQMLTHLENHGMLGLGYAFSGMRHVLSTKPITEPADLAELRVRAFNNTAFESWWTGVGAVPTAVPLPEVNSALTNDVLDALDVDLDAVAKSHFYQQAPYLILTNHMAYPAVIVVSKSYWDSLDEDQQKLLKKSIKEAEEWGYQRAIEAESDSLAAVRQLGVKINEIDVTPFQAVASQLQERYLDGKELKTLFYQQVQEMQ